MGMNLFCKASSRFSLLVRNPSRKPGASRFVRSSPESYDFRGTSFALEKRPPDLRQNKCYSEFLAFAPDGLTSIGGYPGDEEKATNLFKMVDEKKMFEDFVASAAWLKARPECTGKIGAVGFCFGGTTVNNLAVRLPDLGAAVSFCGAE